MHFAFAPQRVSISMYSAPIRLACSLVNKPSSPSSEPIWVAGKQWLTLVVALVVQVLVLLVQLC
jgi:hypothetical protein